MTTIIKGHGLGKLYAETKYDLSTITAQTIKFIKPDGTEGQFSAVVDSESKGIISHEISETDFDQVGYWKCWAYITEDDSSIGIGEPFIVKVVEEGDTF